MEKISRSLEVTIISAEDLRLRRRWIKKNAFVTVRTDSQNCCSTTIDSEGASYPSWNEKFDLALPHSVRHIRVEVQCKTATGVRTIGGANIPVSDFMGDYIPPNYLHFLSYRLREYDGERNGIINLSVRLKVPDYVARTLLPLRAQPPNMNYCGTIALGIPVSYG